MAVNRLVPWRVVHSRSELYIYRLTFTLAAASPPPPTHNEPPPGHHPPPTSSQHVLCSQTGLGEGYQVVNLGAEGAEVQLELPLQQRQGRMRKSNSYWRTPHFEELRQG